MATNDQIVHAAGVFRDGGLVAFATETVYGLGADAANPRALRRLYSVKRRPLTHPAIVHLAAGEQLEEYAYDAPALAHDLAKAFWPGPLTLVVRCRPGRLASAVTGGRDTVGLRVPDHADALALLREFGDGIAAPSANRFGRVSPTTAAHVRADLGEDVDLVLDGGTCTVGVESTIVNMSREIPGILRVGGITEEQIAEIAGAPLVRRTSGEVPAPGTHASHYAPVAHVEVHTRDSVARRARELTESGKRAAVLALHATATGFARGVVLLEAPRDADEYARVLYARLRDADEQGCDYVLAVPPPDTGVGCAVNDRLRRAATGPK